MDKIDAHEETSGLTDHLKRALPPTVEPPLPIEGEEDGQGQKKLNGCFTMVSGCVRKDN